MANECIKVDSVPVKKVVREIAGARAGGVLMLVYSQMMTAADRLSTCWSGPAKEQFVAEFAQLLEDTSTFIRDANTWRNGVSDAMNEYAGGDAEIADQVAKLP